MEKVEWLMKGRYLKNCNCIPACPCDTIGIPAPYKGCEGMGGMLIEQGDFAGVALDGLSWVAVGRWPGALHEGGGEAALFIDERASAEQRNALLTILSGKAGNAWFEFLASTFSTFHEPQFVPIEFEFDKASRRARVVVAGALETVSGPLILPNTGQEHRVTIRMPDGREYLEMEVAQAMLLKGTGAIRFEHRNTHSTMAEVVHTQDGIVR
ncbi:MAG TPA: DUF1326 domain-containing protein [Candidatus Binataceae bacterium]|nr:DUF1326 domain-containing protein [Candidatus Binataceae bacterium]